eukprot:m.190582 g.190582  ORF g.190582 m.190582 type:complete len:55 (+) comp18564_c0_seq5:1110-1274(+)
MSVFTCYVHIQERTRKPSLLAKHHVMDDIYGYKQAASSMHTNTTSFRKSLHARR